MLYSLLRPLLFSLAPETAHHLALQALKVLPYQQHSQTKAKVVCGIPFKNAIGLAAGLDKNGAYVDALAKLGFGFIEVGTVTPKGQAGNEMPRLFRATKDKAIINRMGFNNDGVLVMIENLKKQRYSGVLGINIGKNKNTPLNQAKEDYLYCLKALAPYATYITINISSPNTPDLRALQQKDYLSDLLMHLDKARNQCIDKLQKQLPLFIKISPDESIDDLKSMVSLITKHKMDGIIATNTTIDKSQLSDEALKGEAGGLSGKPLLKASNDVVSVIRKSSDLPIIGVGGIMNAKDGQEKLALGCDLLQVYTGLIYQGPQLVKALAKANVSSAFRFTRC